jgi:hypothetical protein
MGCVEGIGGFLDRVAGSGLARARPELWGVGGRLLWYGPHDSCCML